jgi:hypothetical protein
MPNIRRIRYATKGPAVMPQKLLTDDAWLDALTRVVEQGRRQHKGRGAAYPLQSSQRDQRKSPGRP